MTLLALSLWAGCGDDATGPPLDGSVAVDGGVAPAAPQIPWESAGAPPIEAPAAPAAPHPGAAPARCGLGEAHFFGEVGCAPIGEPCPGGDFAAGLPADVRVIYVRPGATGGDGTLARPHGSLHDFSIGGLSPGTVIALARGRFDAALRLPSGIVLWGACAGGTLLGAGASSLADGVVTVLGEGVVLRDLTISDSPRAGVLVSGVSAGVELVGVEISAVESVGVRVGEGASLSATGLVIRDTRSRSADLRFGRGVSIETGGVARITRASLESNLENGFFVADPGTSLTLGDVIVRDTGSQMLDGRLGRGMSVQAGASVQVTRGDFEGNHDGGLYVSGEGTRLVFEDVVVRDTAARVSDGTHGISLSVFGSSMVQGSRALFTGSRESALDMEGTGVQVDLEDLTIQDTVGRTRDDTLGRGVNATLGAHLRLSRGLIERSAEYGLFAMDPGTDLVLQDLVVRDTAGQASDGAQGRGLQLQDGPTATVTRALFERNHEASLAIEGAGTTLRLQDVLIDDTLRRVSDGAAGRAINVQDGAGASGSRVVLDHNRETALLVDGAGASASFEDIVVGSTQEHGDLGRALTAQSGGAIRLLRGRLDRNIEVGAVAMHPGSSLELTDVLIEGTQSRSRDGTFGYGLAVERSATASLAHVSIMGNRDVGILVSHQAELSGEDVRVHDTRARGCAATSCPDAPSGSAVVAAEGGHLSLTDGSIVGASLCGLLIARGGAVDLVRGEVAECTIGACVQVPDYDFGRITRDVRYRDNMVNLESTSLPVPDPAAEIER